MNETTEKTYYRNGDVLVTSARVVFGTKTYALSNVTTVALYRQRPSYVVPVALFCLAGFMGWLYSLIHEETLGAIAVLLVVIGVVLAFLLPPRYWVRIGGASGESNAMWGKKEPDIREIVNAVNEAIIGRG